MAVDGAPPAAAPSGLAAAAGASSAGAPGGGGPALMAEHLQPVFNDLLPRLLHCCYGGRWQSLLGGLLGVGELIASGVPLDFLQQHEAAMVRALLHILRRLPDHSHVQAAEVGAKLDQLLELCHGGGAPKSAEGGGAAANVGVVVAAAPKTDPVVEGDPLKTMAEFLGVSDADALPVGPPLSAEAKALAHARLQRTLQRGPALARGHEGGAGPPGAPHGHGGGGAAGPLSRPPPAVAAPPHPRHAPAGGAARDGGVPELRPQPEPPPAEGGDGPRDEAPRHPARGAQGGGEPGGRARHGRAHPGLPAVQPGRAADAAEGRLHRAAVHRHVQRQPLSAGGRAAHANHCDVLQEPHLPHAGDRRGVQEGAAAGDPAAEAAEGAAAVLPAPHSGPHLRAPQAPLAAAAAGAGPAARPALQLVQRHARGEAPGAPPALARPGEAHGGAQQLEAGRGAADRGRADQRVPPPARHGAQVPGRARDPLHRARARPPRLRHPLRAVQPVPRLGLPVPQHLQDGGGGLLPGVGRQRAEPRGQPGVLPPLRGDGALRRGRAAVRGAGGVPREDLRRRLRGAAGVGRGAAPAGGARAAGGGAGGAHRHLRRGAWGGGGGGGARALDGEARARRLRPHAGAGGAHPAHVPGGPLFRYARVTLASHRCHVTRARVTLASTSRRARVGVSGSAPALR
eukprot:1175750-Prorocentrum_minimum.AAC.1